MMPRTPTLPGVATLFLALAAAAAGISAGPARAQQARPPITTGQSDQAARARQIQDRRTNAALDEAEGKYPAPTGSSLPLGAVQPAFANPKPAADQTAVGVKHYDWSQDLIMRIRARRAMDTVIQFPAWEHIDQVFLGDRRLFDAKAINPNTVFVTALRAGADTNLVVTASSGNVYNFYVRGESEASDIVPDMQVYVDVLERIVPGAGPRNTGSPEPVNDPLLPVSGPNARPGPSTAPHPFQDTANGDRTQGAKPPVKKEAAYHTREIPYDPASAVYDLGIFVPDKASIAIAPKRVWHDDVWTYFDFGEKTDGMPERPVVSLLIDGVDSPVNTRTAGSRNNIVIAQAIGNFTLRDGNKLVCVKRLPPGQKPLTATQVTVGSKGPIPPDAQESQSKDDDAQSVDSMAADSTGNSHGKPAGNSTGKPRGLWDSLTHPFAPQAVSSEPTPNEGLQQ